jgi:D-glycero-D-manno-heptose 1,7-bisphosphate phosphatase
MKKLATDLREAGASFDGFYYCPHRPAADCACRKPRTGLLDEAATRFNWIPERSWVIGDKFSDVELGWNAGLGSVLVRTGYGILAEASVRDRWPASERVLVADDLLAAVAMILTGPGDRGEGSPS